MFDFLGAVAQLINTIIGWILRRATERERLENEPIEDVRQVQRELSAGDEAAVQRDFHDWALHGGGLRLYQPPLDAEPGDRGTGRDGAP